MKDQVKVETLISAPIDKIWKYWNEPEHIVKWNTASDDWHTPKSENDLRVGGKFKARMEAKDGSQGFDFEGTYTIVDEKKRIDYEMSDGRKVSVEFAKEGDAYRVIEKFDPEDENPIAMQKEGWQNILNNFKRYTEETNA